MTEILFETPPAQRRGTGQRTGKHFEAAEKLRARPGEWGVVAICSTPSSSASLAYLIRRGGLAAYRPKGAFEAVSRTVDDERRVYARYKADPE
jgi:hypothetical protein